MSLKFGTDGWRAVIADQFTFDNVRRVTRAVDEVMPRTGTAVVVGYDTRFQSAAFARAAAETFAAAGRDVILTDAPCPTPAVSCQVVSTGAPFGVSITASHNPPEFNGFKIKSPRGASAPPEITRRVEERLAETSEPPPGSGGAVRTLSFVPEHARRLAGMVDLERIRRSGVRVVFDTMHGATGRLLEEILASGTMHVETLHAEPDPLFGGVNPEPLEANLLPLRERMRSGGADIGLATDGDGDRIGAFDEKGRFVTPLQIAPLLALGMIARGARGEICKTFANTILLDRIAERHGLPFSVFPIGFKYIAERMERSGFMIGGEESGGIGIAGFLPERDGLLISLMLLEVLAAEGKPLSELLDRMGREYGTLRYARRDIPCPTEKGRALAASLKKDTPRVVGKLPVSGVEDLDGVKLLFGGEGWILVRASGTEPVLRVYCEAPTDADVHAALEDLVTRVSGG